jgi:hypothetical protein
MKQRFIICFTCLLSTNVFAQVFIQPEFSYGTFAMSSLKDFQLDLIKSSNVSLQPITTFPSYFGFGLKLGAQVDADLSCGVTLHYYSTGSRSYYEDYSGLARIDMIPQAFSAGIFFKNRMNKSERWQLFSSLSILWVRTKLNLASEVKLGSQSQVENADFNSNNYSVRPNFILCRPVTETVYLEASAGYEFQLEGKLYVSGSDKAYLINSKGNEVLANWSGLRFTVGVGIFLNKKLKPQS